VPLKRGVHARNLTGLIKKTYLEVVNEVVGTDVEVEIVVSVVYVEKVVVNVDNELKNKNRNHKTQSEKGATTISKKIEKLRVIC